MTGFSSIEERRRGQLFQTNSLLLNLLRSARTRGNIHFSPISVSRSLAAQPDAATLVGLVVSCASMQPRDDALDECDVGERCRVSATACKKSAAQVGLRTCVELRRSRNSLSGGRP